ncbi:MAG: hypothetical protein GX256_10075 [Fretibacterium sp.]|nr:hypothetical protein [Fretibacterium sp.]
MDFLLAVFLFIAGLGLALFKGWALAWPLLGGIACFATVALRRGLPLREVFRAMLQGTARVSVVLRLLVLVGLLTGSWRACGTVAYFVFHGVSVLQPHSFVLFAFLLSSAASFILGSSFGATGTIGVVLMTLAHKGGVPPEIAAGAILSGIYFGDRSSPVSSCAALVAALANTPLHDHVRAMLRGALLPFLLAGALYGLVSLFWPLGGSVSHSLSDLPQLFNLSWPAAAPAVLVLFLALMRVSVPLSISLSTVMAGVLAMTIQGLSSGELIRALILGYHPKVMEGTAILMAGGGLISMSKALITVSLASGLSGILKTAGLLRELQGFLLRVSKRLSLFQTTLATSFFASIFSGSQTLTIVLTHQLVGPLYEEPRRLALDLSDAAALLPDLIPWNLALMGPLAMLSVDAKAVLWLYFPTLLILVRLLGDRRKKGARV